MSRGGSSSPRKTARGGHPTGCSEPPLWQPGPSAESGGLRRSLGKKGNEGACSCVTKHTCQRAHDSTSVFRLTQSRSAPITRITKHPAPLLTWGHWEDESSARIESVEMASRSMVKPEALRILQIRHNHYGLIGVLVGRRWAAAPLAFYIAEPHGRTAAHQGKSLRSCKNFPKRWTATTNLLFWVTLNLYKSGLKIESGRVKIINDIC